MPKLSKEKRDMIFDLINKDYTNVEISAKVGVSTGTVSRYRKKAPKKEGKSDPVTGLSAKSMSKLFNLQGMLGKNSLNEAIDEIFKYSVDIMKRKFDYDPESEQTPSDIFEYVTKQEREYNRLKKGKREPIIQREILAGLGIDDHVFEYYCLGRDLGFKGTYVDFLAEYTIKYCTEVNGWGVSRKTYKIDIDRMLEKGRLPYRPPPSV